MHESGAVTGDGAQERIRKKKCIILPAPRETEKGSHGKEHCGSGGEQRESEDRWASACFQGQGGVHEQRCEESSLVRVSS